MQSRDIRGHALYREAEELLRIARAPGGSRLTDAAQLHAAPAGHTAVFTGTIVSSLTGTPAGTICSVDLDGGQVRVLTDGPGHTPRYSPDGRRVAFISDRHAAGDFQLYFLAPSTGAIEAAPQVDGWVEYLHWSPDGRRVLLGVAGHGADIAGGFGATKTHLRENEVPEWAPRIETGAEEFLWRRAWVCEPGSGKASCVSPPGINVWEAVWCGPERLAAVVSPGPREGLWYSASLVLIDVRNGEVRPLYTSKDQLGCLAGSPGGQWLAVVEAVCSDRGIVAGDLLVLDTSSGAVRAFDTAQVDVSYTCFRSDDRLSIAGQRRLDSVVGTCRLDTGAFVEEWSGTDLTSGGRYISVAPCGIEGRHLLVGEGFRRAPEIGVIEKGDYRTLVSFDCGYADYMAAHADVLEVRWTAPDGLALDGWLMHPRSKGPHPLVMDIHGGPVWQWRPRWLGREGLHSMLLNKHGYAVFWPNPRGSAGYGRAFARRVQGDMGGADVHDYLSGIDHLVTESLADPGRLGVTGRSYGGFMTCWLVTLDHRFAAAVALAPSTDKISGYLTSNIPEFASLFFGDEYDNPSGKFITRAPVMFARNVRTPVLSVCGGLDRCTPPGQAVEFHNALLLQGKESVLITYPQEGHGNRRLEAMVDYAARITAWFEKYMPAV